MSEFMFVRGIIKMQAIAMARADSINVIRFLTKKSDNLNFDIAFFFCVKGLHAVFVVLVVYC